MGDSDPNVMTSLECSGPNVMTSLECSDHPTQSRGAPHSPSMEAANVHTVAPLHVLVHSLVIQYTLFPTRVWSTRRSLQRSRLCVTYTLIVQRCACKEIFYRELSRSARVTLLIRDVCESRSTLYAGRCAAVSSPVGGAEQASSRQQREERRRRIPRTVEHHMHSLGRPLVASAFPAGSLFYALSFPAQDKWTGKRLTLLLSVMGTYFYNYSG